MGDNYVTTGQERFLDAVDCTIFFGMMIISVAIGLYFAFVNRRKPNTASEYLTGNKELPVFPIAMSLCSSYISAITFMAQPAEIYNYGSQMAMVALVEVFAVFAMLYLLMPVFYNLNIISSYEYLTKRFNYKIGMLGSSLFVIKTLLYSSVVLYFPAIVVSQLFGWKLEYIIPMLSIACIFYTAIGGFRAVVWTDTLQTFYMTSGALTITILGLYKIGGFTEVWERNEKSGRIEFFNFDPDPRTRTTIWTVAIGFFTFSLSEKSVNQMVMQRFSSLSNFEKVKTTSWIFAVFLFIIFAVTSFNGLIAFAAFYDCDPVTTKAISKFDQIVSYLWMYLTRGIPGLPGLFVSAIFTASLSTISTNLNSTAGVFVIDIVKPTLKREIQETKETFLIKIMVVCFGCTLIVFAFVIDQLTGLYQVALSVVGVMNGPIFGMFILGMFCPRVSAKAVLVATLVSFSLVTWIYVGAQIAMNQKQIIYPSKPFSIQGCDNRTLERYYNNLQEGGIPQVKTDLLEAFPLYALSYQYYALIGSVATTFVGLIISYLPGFKESRKLSINLYSPIVQKIVVDKCENAGPKSEKNRVI